ncbi:hypothetical protein Klosneuvirus_1_146 [Klosneuvirus KNV1]|uniref:Uncharacterized protein n=1 Tax=Klosneuvirus KNV1 TaxID=1977640 RepID=A0A1V0SHT7_9VIRU|nr:hypothetical protein Klosneuvirus_1_146 [Klosneuvirus KNV1]
MDKEEIDEFAGYGPDANFIRSIMTPASEDYESDLIKFIKQSGVIPEGSIKRTDNWISSYDENGKLEGSGIANAGSIELTYKLKYINCRDKKTIELLEDKQIISFIDESVPSITPTENDSSDDEDSGIRYKAYMDKTYKLQDPDIIVHPCSYVNIHYDTPNWKEHATFRIPADDEIKGFTRHELMKKALERFHMLYYIFSNYNIDDGKVNPEKPSCLFHPLLFINDYTDNGLRCLEYNKEKNYWVFECMEEH